MIRSTTPGAGLYFASSRRSLAMSGPRCRRGDTHRLRVPIGRRLECRPPRRPAAIPRCWRYWRRPSPPPGLLPQADVATTTTVVGAAATAVGATATTVGAAAATVGAVAATLVATAAAAVGAAGAEWPGRRRARHRTRSGRSWRTSRGLPTRSAKRLSTSWTEAIRACLGPAWTPGTAAVDRVRWVRSRCASADQVGKHRLVMRLPAW